ncbi:aspartic peptidase domain-containing protein [Chytridium lagenaria]|nr:aspartic peptidase domain-containing protein [Chytridium lagenaria]
MPKPKIRTNVWTQSSTSLLAQHLRALSKDDRRHCMESNAMGYGIDGGAAGWVKKVHVERRDGRTGRGVVRLDLTSSHNKFPDFRDSSSVLDNKIRKGSTYRAGQKDRILLTGVEDVVTIYKTTVLVGSPPRPHIAVLDTGSRSTWFRTTTIVASSISHLLEYADGTRVDGTWGREWIGMDGVERGVENFEMLVAESVTGRRQGMVVEKVDGVVGMAVGRGGTFGGFQSDDRPGFFESLWWANDLDRPQFTYFINVSDDSGAAIFGGTDPTLFAYSSDTITWISLTTNPALAHNWAISILTIALEDSGNSSNSLPAFTYTFNTTSVILDTGTSLAYMPASFVEALGKRVAFGRDEGSGTFFVPCAMTAKGEEGFVAPLVWVTVGNGVKVVITPEEYVVKVKVADQEGEVREICILGFQAMTEGMEVAVLGNTFLKRYVTTFDYGSRKLGLVLAKGRNTLPNNLSSITGAGVGNDESAPLPTRQLLIDQDFTATRTTVSTAKVRVSSSAAKLKRFGIRFYYWFKDDHVFALALFDDEAFVRIT